MNAPVVVDFPLRGEWIAPNTPGTKVPSHGTDQLGQTYAFDFLGVEPNGTGKRFYPISTFRYLLFGVPLAQCYGWGRPIYAATAGTVIQAHDGVIERDPVNLARDMANMFKNARDFNSKHIPDLHVLTGNSILVESADGYVLYAHAQNGSIRVSVGDKIVPGQQIASVGHSGNSTAPHLHFQLMDNLDPWKAKGIPCCFREYEVFKAGAWQTVENGIPTAEERIRRL
jgi:murein DD-endopeptidase MepM/ murein hydrolase activator NlpD